MKHINEKAVAAAATRVWSVKDFCKLYRVAEAEEKKLLRLFGEYATSCELRYNVKRQPRWH
ncbi:hypothetical protein OCK02_21425 [Rhizobium sp. TRM96647]|uniref:hypothetical protein n=1 Tax=unclassified Rhizobium TaxID=2613769 RepID=UPI0021E747AF|nr:MULTISPECIES: hypothetical protein [unclassified Rhizobium]MCV3738749.1 hypothetical protein [Rhizobium sp. TRM96647]MCV3760436.1 hypothetical protein [Rhizobium sp. TRM96650]